MAADLLAFRTFLCFDRFLGHGLHRLALVQQIETSLDALECLDALTLELHEDACRICVRATTDLFGFGTTLGDDLLGALLGGARQLALLDEERGLFRGPPEDPLG